MDDPAVADRGGPAAAVRRRLLRPQASGLQTGLVLLHLAGVARRGVGGLGRGQAVPARQRPGGGSCSWSGTLMIVAAYLFSRQVPGIGYSHEMAPGAAVRGGAGGRLLAGRLISARLLPVAAAVLARVRADAGRQRAAPAGARRRPAAHLVPGRAPPRLRPVRLLAGRRDHARHREPDRCPGAAGEPGQRSAPVTGSRTRPGTTRGSTTRRSCCCSRGSPGSPARPG